MAGNFFELLLNWTPSRADPHVRKWLEGRGLTAMPMKAGILTLATRDQIEKSFGISGEAVQPSVELPVLEKTQANLLHDSSGASVIRIADGSVSPAPNLRMKTT